jgi:hypothetical protein
MIGQTISHYYIVEKLAVWVWSTKVKTSSCIAMSR